MKTHQLVCPFDKELLGRLPGKTVVVCTDDIDMLPEIEPFTDTDHHLQAIVLKTGQALSEVLPLPNWGCTTLYLYVSELGMFRNIAPYIEQLRSANLKVFMPSAKSANLSGIRILSSLGISCGLIIDGQPPDWEAVSDLMHYAIYSKLPRAMIEPFCDIARHYKPSGQVDFAAVYFDDPSKYLHISREGCIASNCYNLNNNHFISESLCDLENINENQRYQEELNKWRRFFLHNDGCAYCQAWRICMGRFADQAADGACEKFFCEMMEAAEFMQSLKPEDR